MRCGRRPWGDGVEPARRGVGDAAVTKTYRQGILPARYRRLCTLAAPLRRGFVHWVRAALYKPPAEQALQCAKPGCVHCGSRSDGGLYGSRTDSLLLLDGAAGARGRLAAPQPPARHWGRTRPARRYQAASSSVGGRRWKLNAVQDLGGRVAVGGGAVTECTSAVAPPHPEGAVGLDRGGVIVAQ